MSSRLVVIGDGWAALSALVDALRRNASQASSWSAIHWVAGTGGRVLPPVPSVEGERAARAVEQMAEFLGVETGERVPGGSFLREFRNKSFRNPIWNKGADLVEQRERRATELWKAEVSLMPLDEHRWGRSLFEIEEDLRTRLLEHPSVRRHEGIPVEGFEMNDGVPVAVLLGSGERIEADQFVYADRWSKLPALSGLPKSLPWNRSREPMGVLQVVLAHHDPIRPEVQEAFFATLNRDSGETEDRHVVGHFYREGRESVWSTIISPEEGEDNHAIAKKLRRIKQALDKMFSQSEWASGEFSDTIRSEQVRYEESMVFGAGVAPSELMSLSKGRSSNEALRFATDGYGVAAAITPFFDSCEPEPMGLAPSTQPETLV